METLDVTVMFAVPYILILRKHTMQRNLSFLMERSRAMNPVTFSDKFRIKMYLLH